MALVKLNRDPSRAELRWFGVLFAGFFGLVGLMASRGSDRTAAVLWGFGAGVAVLYYAVPPLRRPIYLAWVYATYPIGFVISYVVLALVYFAVFAPTGLALRILGRDPLERRFERARASYWVEHPGSTPHSRYFKQYCREAP
jgi:hypothetical protein